MKSRHRADQLLFDQGLAESREKAKRLIMAGQVFVLSGNGRERIDKPGRALSKESALMVLEDQRFVSRGGYKLLTAVERFDLHIQDKVCLDVGASTGGFTDCLLQHGARKVYAVDVGYGQLHWKLREHERVVNLEKINIRTAPEDLFSEQVDFLTMDCSFISAILVLKSALKFLRPGGEIVALIKPQFEVGPGQTCKGVVKSLEVAQEALHRVRETFIQDLGLTYRGVTPSAIKGPKGNQEYLLYLEKYYDP